MEWLILLRLMLLLIAIYVVLPGFAQPRRPHESTLVHCVRASVRVFFLTEYAGILLGLIGLALPGTILSLVASWLVAEVLPRLPRTRRQLADVLVSSHSGRSLGARWAWSSNQIGLFAIALIAAAWFPVYNFRLTTPDAFSRAESLAVLASGNPWKLDPSVALLLPLQMISALPQARVIAFGEALSFLTLLFAVYFAVYQRSDSRAAAFYAAAIAACLRFLPWIPVCPERGRIELGLTFATLAFALWPKAKTEAVQAAAIGGAILGSVSDLSFLESAVPFIAAVGLGMGFSGFCRRDRISVGGAGAAFLGLALLGSWNVIAMPSDGPLQYESAARAALALSATRLRNTWTLISPSQEVANTYGYGWHTDLDEFVQNSSESQVGAKDYRFPFPSAEVYFFIERSPLGSPEHVALEYRAASLLAAYASSHSDLRTLYRGKDLVVYSAVRP